MEYAALCEAIRQHLKDADSHQWAIGKLLWEQFDSEDGEVGGRTIAHLAETVGRDVGYLRTCRRVYRYLYGWWERQTDQPYISICRITVNYDSERAVELMEKWIELGRPGVAAWRDYLEERDADPDEHQEKLELVARLLRKSRRANLDGELARMVPLRGVKPDQADAIDKTCEFWVRLRARIRAIKRARRRAS